MWVSRKADHKKVPKFQKGHYYTPGVWRNRKSVTSCNPPEVVGIESPESLTNLDLTGEEGTTLQCLTAFSGQSRRVTALQLMSIHRFCCHSPPISLSQTLLWFLRRRGSFVHTGMWFLCSAWVSPTPLQGLRDIWITPWLLLVSGHRWVSRENTTVWKDMQPSTHHFY